jgi:hypothetical protein
MPLEKALAELAALKNNEHIPYTVLAKKHGCCRTTLSRRHKGACASNEVKSQHQLVLHPRDEIEVVQYVKSLTERHLMPTRKILRRIVTSLCKWEPSDRWVSRFLHRYPDDLLTAWTTPMEKSRHDAASYDSFCSYFDLLHSTIKQHSIEPENTYNMDEKGFMIGVMSKSVRIFDKQLFGRRKYKLASHDGNRKWVTVVGAVGADGFVLPPAVIYPSSSLQMQESWVQRVKAEKHDLHVGTSVNGWTNDTLGVAWLKQVFNRYTRVRARGKYRLLILDGHGSHVTQAFIEYAHANKILLLIFPPHATHALQPLDVACYGPLSQNYSMELLHRGHTTEGWVPVAQADFFPLFWAAWKKTFTKDLVVQAFKCTGIYPPDADVVLKKFKVPTPRTPSTTPEPTELQPAPDPPSWRKMQRLLKRAREDDVPGAAEAVDQALHQLHVRLEISEARIEGLEEALKANKNKKRKRKVLPLQPIDGNDGGGAVLWSPSRIERAKQELQAKEDLERAAEAAKATKKELQHQKKIIQAKEKEDKRVEREKKKVLTAKAQAAKRAQTKARKEEAQRKNNAEESTQLPKKAKSKASQKPQSKVTKNRGGGAVRRRRVAHKAPSPPPPTKASTGRTTRPPKKLW